MIHEASSQTALIVIDVQRAFDEWEAAGKRRNNPEALARIVELLTAFRDRQDADFPHPPREHASEFFLRSGSHRLSGQG